MVRSLLIASITFPIGLPSLASAADNEQIAGRTQKEWVKILQTEESPRKRYAAVSALGLFDTLDKATIAALQDAFVKDKAENVRLKAVEVTHNFKREQLSPLVRGLGDTLRQDKSAAVRTAAAVALGKAGEGAKPVISVIAEAFTDAEPKVRAAAAEALGRIGDEARGTIPRLIPLLKDADATVRLAATFALGRVGAEASVAVPDLCVVLAKDPDDNVRKEAARAFNLLGLNAKASVPALAKALREDKSVDVRQMAATALGKMTGAIGEAVTPMLEAIRKDADRNVRSFTVHSLGNSLGDGLRAYVKPLADALIQEQDGDVKVAIIQELAVLGPGAKEALPALQRMAADVQLSVRDEARKAVAKVGGVANPKR